MTEPLINKEFTERALDANIESLKGFSPRFVARTLGCSLGDVISMCKRKEALGQLERYEVNGEIYYRRRRQNL
jgi:hypothetical protein